MSARTTLPVTSRGGRLAGSPRKGTVPRVKTSAFPNQVNNFASHHDSADLWRSCSKVPGAHFGAFHIYSYNNHNTKRTFAPLLVVATTTDYSQLYWTWRPQLEPGDGPLESHEQRLSNVPSMTSTRGLRENSRIQLDCEVRANVIKIFLSWSEPQQDMERSWSEGFSWSQVDSSSVELESALRGRSQPGVSFRNWSQPGVNLRKLESTWSQHLKVGASFREGKITKRS